jgi:hypothetical protein
MRESCISGSVGAPGHDGPGLPDRPSTGGRADSAQDRDQELEHDRTFVRVLAAVTGESAPSVR